jgi:hypothetical protein
MSEKTEWKALRMFFPRLVADWVTVWTWNPYLYRRVAVSGFVLGFLTAVMIAGAVATVWLVLIVNRP